MSTVIHNEPGREIEAGDALVSLPPHTIVALGEYADQGEPDVLVRVVHAVNENGDDISDEVARKIAKALEPTDER
jgi:hypothetical protein